MNKNIPVSMLFCLLALSCSNSKNFKNNQAATENVVREDTSLNKNTDQKIITFLTFQKEDAELAMNFYIELFDNSKIIKLNRWGKDGPGKEGTIMHATFSLDGKLFMCSDSPPIHDWDFTPGVSNYVECENDEELERLYTKFSENGEVAMPLGNYGFSKKFGWVIDQFGISWQLNLS